MAEIEIREYAPITIPTLCRYEHFKRLVDSLAQNTHAGKTELIIGLDYPPSAKYAEGWEKISKYIPSITGFKKITVLRAEQNIGAVANSRRIREYAFDHYNTLIYTEDDNEFSPCFLDYINKALTKYWDEPKVINICGYGYPVDLQGYNKNIYFHHDSSAWGIANWKHKSTIISTEYAHEVVHSISKSIKLIRADSRLYFSLLYMISKNTRWGDAINGAKNIIEQKYVMYPTISMCRNHGHDGSGEHCGKTDGIDIYRDQPIHTEATFDIDEIEIVDCQHPALKKYFQMPWRQKLRAAINYLGFKL